MGVVEVILIGVSVAMDAFAVSICKGMTMKKNILKKAIIIGLYFGAFQILMPLIGYTLGTMFSGLIEAIDHWLAFILLSILGINMIKESLSDEEETSNDKVDFKTMFPLAIATSIDALVIGITFSFLNTNLFLSLSVIGIITFLFCIIGTLLGKKFSNKFGSKSGILGGVILILIGLKTLLDHLGIL